MKIAVPEKENSFYKYVYEKDYSTMLLSNQYNFVFLTNYIFINCSNKLVVMLFIKIGV